MQRAPFIGSGRISDGHPFLQPDPSYSKSRKRQQGVLQRAQNSFGRLSLPGKLLITAAAVLLPYILWRLLHRAEPQAIATAATSGSTDWRGRAQLPQQLRALIDQTDKERGAALVKLKPVHGDWQRLRGELRDHGENVREAMADVDRLEEMHTQRMESLDDMSGHNRTLAAQMKQEWEAEVLSSHARLSQAKEQLSDVQWREDEAHSIVVQLHDEARAFAAAAASLQQVVKDRSQELEIGLVQMLDGQFHRETLIGLFKPRGDDTAWHHDAGSISEAVQRMLGDLPDSSGQDGTAEHWQHARPPPFSQEGDTDIDGFHEPAHLSIVEPQLGDSKVRIQRHESAHEDIKGARTGQAGIQGPPGTAIQQSTDGDVVFRAHPPPSSESTDQSQAGKLNLPNPPPQNPSLTESAAAEAERKQREAQLNAELQAKLAAKMTGGDGFVSRGKDNSRMGRAGGQTGSVAKPEQEDDSVRCRTSKICEGVLECGAGDELGCITDAKERQAKIRDAAKWAWQGYREHAWGQDELLPLSKTGSRWFNLGLTLVDALDTLLLMRLDAEFEEARKWVAQSLDVAPDTEVNLFETTIRVLGGLLAAFHLSGGDEVFLFRAAELGVRLEPAFDSPSGVPWSDVNLKTHHVAQPKWTLSSSTSETTSVDMELFFLGHATGEQGGARKAIAAVETLLASPDLVEGLAPIFVSPERGVFVGSQITLGARGDSFYEYLLKQWLLSGKQDDKLLKGYKQAMRGLRHLLLKQTAPEGGLLYVAELHSKSPFAKMDHLVCFLPGLMALGHWHGVATGDAHEQSDLDIARQLMATCYEMYRRTPAGLSPEIVFFDNHEGGDFPKKHAGDVGGGDFHIKPQDSHNLLRPETVESLFVMWRVTGDPLYRAWGWHIFRAFEKWTRLDGGGYANLHDVLQVPPPKRDKMESFWLAETLKYLYLMFDDSQPAVLPLDQFVFNTEAHPLPIVGSAADKALQSHYQQRPSGVGGASADNRTVEARAQAWRKAATDLVAGQYGSSTSTAKRMLAKLIAL